jgi:4-hydroxybenzoate polyprenyltransferase
MIFQIINIIFLFILFFLGSVLMRSAGCIVNDILDRKFDKKVLRTKNRPIASGKISVILDYFMLLSYVYCFFSFNKF